MMPNTSGNYSSTNQYGTSVAALSVLRCIPLIFIGIASFVGNALVLIAIYRFKNLRTFSNAYIGNLAITDLLASFVMLFSYTTLLLDGTWVFGDALCKIQGITLIILSTATLLTMLCFSIYRCYLVTTVSKRLSVLRLGKIVKYSVGLIWLLAVLYSIPLLFGAGDVNLIPAYYSCLYDFSSSRKYSIFLFLFLFAIPLSVMCVAYMRIIRFIKMHNKAIIDRKPSDEERQSQSDFAGQPSLEESEKDDGDHFTVMELKRKLEEIEDENTTDWKEPERLNEDEEEQVEENMEWEQTIDEEAENEVIKMKPVSLSLTSDCVPENVRSYTLHEMSLEKQYGDKSQRRFSLNISPSHMMQRLKSRFERQKLLRQYKQRVSYQARLARILIATLVLFVICWTPMSVDSFFLGIGYTQERPKFFQLTSLWFAYTNALCNPIVYALLNNNFKVAFKKILNGVFNRIYVCRSSLSV